MESSLTEELAFRRTYDSGSVERGLPTVNKLMHAGSVGYWTKYPRLSGGPPGIDRTEAGLVDLSIALNASSEARKRATALGPRSYIVASHAGCASRHQHTFHRLLFPLLLMTRAYEVIMQICWASASSQNTAPVIVSTAIDSAGKVTGTYCGT